MPEKLPAYQWYPGDWRRHPGVQALTYEERGVWRELLDFMHASTHRGRLVYSNGTPVDDAGIAQMLGIAEASWKQIRSKLVTKTGVANEGADGALESRRMIKDERTRKARAIAGSKGGSAGKNGGRLSKQEANEKQKNPPSVAVAVSVSPSKQEEPPELDLTPGLAPPPSRKRSWRFCPPDWNPAEAHAELARKLHLDLNAQVQSFRDHEFAKPKTDADAAFSNWLRRSAEMRRPNGNGHGPAARRHVLRMDQQ